MQKLKASSPEAKSANLVADNIEQLKALFPELITEGLINGKPGVTVNVDVLKALVGDQTATDADEKYGLNWHGKRRARQLALTPSTGTLRPCPDESADWDTTQNLMIEGDNLEVLKLLQKSYAGKVKLIYIDPPYNTGKDFVYPDNFQDNIQNYLSLTGQLEGGNKITSNTETSGRFHTDWLNMMYPRLKIARNLLTEDGVIFVSINQGEIDNIKLILNEIFGEENFVNIFSWVRTRTPAALSQKTKNIVEYVICYERSSNNRPLLGIEKPALSANTLLNQPNAIGTLEFPAGIETGISDGSLKPGAFGSDSYPVELLDAVDVFNGKFCSPFRLQARFRWSQEYLLNQMASGTKIRIATERLLPSYEKDSYGREALPNLIDEKVKVGTNESAGVELEVLMGARIFDYPKPVSLLQYLVNSCTTGDDIVLDFFAGSGTTGHAVMAQNVEDGGSRRYILVQLPEALALHKKEQENAARYCANLGKPLTLAELTKERLRKVMALLREKSLMPACDLGFRVFRLDESNVRAWMPHSDHLEQSLFDHEMHLLDGRTDLDIFCELLLKLGLQPSLPIEVKAVAGGKLYGAGGGVLAACLWPEVRSADVEGIAASVVDWCQALSPIVAATCVFRDDAFSDDVAKVNMTSILEQSNIRACSI